MIALAAAAVLAAAPTPSPTPPAEALVLGLRDSKGLSTWFVDESGAKRLGSGLAVPRKDGWWKLDVATQTQGDSSRQVIVASKDAHPAPKPWKLDDGCQETDTVELPFAGGDSVSAVQSGGGMCEGAAHPWQAYNVVFGTFESAAKGDGVEALSIAKVLGPDASTALQKAGKALLAKRGDEACLGDPDDAAWGLVRKDGRWQVRGELPYAAEACRDRHEEFDVPVAVPKEIAGPDALPKPYAEYGKTQAALTDVLASPSGRIEVIVTRPRFDVWFGGKRVGGADESGASVVMAQWALGASNVTRWRSEAGKLLGGS